MFERKVVIFDLDDTLVPNVIYYAEAKKKVAKILKRIFGKTVSEKTLIEEFGAIDLVKAKKLCLSRNRFPLTAVELYMKYCDTYKRTPISDEIDEVMVAASTVFDVVEEVSSKMEDVITKIQTRGFKVFLLTAGDEVVQTFKIYKTGVYKIIPPENIIIVPEKKDDVYTKLFSKYGLENCCMVGNSRKGDINPALNAGMFAIYIPEYTWEYDHEKLRESDKLYTIHNFSDIPEILNEMFVKDPIELACQI